MTQRCTPFRPTFGDDISVRSQFTDAHAWALASMVPGGCPSLCYSSGRGSRFRRPGAYPSGHVIWTPGPTQRLHHHRSGYAAIMHGDMHGCHWVERRGMVERLKSTWRYAEDWAQGQQLWPTDRTEKTIEERNARHLRTLRDLAEWEAAGELASDARRYVYHNEDVPANYGWMMANLVSLLRANAKHQDTGDGAEARNMERRIAAMLPAK